MIETHRGTIKLMIVMLLQILWWRLWR